MAHEPTDDTQRLFASCLDSAFYNYNDSETPDSVDNFFDAFSTLYRAARNRYDGQQNTESFYSSDSHPGTLFHDLYIRCLSRLNSDDVLDITASRYDCLTKVAAALREFRAEHSTLTPLQIAELVANDLREKRVRPLSRQTRAVLRTAVADPFYVLLDGIRYALPRLLDTAHAPRASDGNAFFADLHALFDRAIVVAVDTARPMFRNDLDGVRSFIAATVKSTPASLQVEQFENMTTSFLTQLILGTYCRKRGVAYSFTPSEDVQTCAESLDPLFQALGTIEDIAHRFHRCDAQPSDLLRTCLADATAKDYFYRLVVDGSSRTLWEGMSFADILACVPADQEPPVVPPDNQPPAQPTINYI